MLKTRTCTIIAVVMIIVYAGLSGTSAYLQYKSHEIFQEMTDGKGSAMIDTSDPATKALNEKYINLINKNSLVARGSLNFLLAAVAAVSALFIVKKLPLKHYLAATIGSLAVGAIVLIPVWLTGGAGIRFMNYYSEPFFFACICLVIMLVSIGARSVSKSK